LENDVYGISIEWIQIQTAYVSGNPSG